MNEMDSNAINVSWVDEGMLYRAVTIWCNSDDDAVKRERVKVAFNYEILMVVAERMLLDWEKKKK